MKRFLYSLLLVAILVPQVSLAADSYGWSMFFTVPGTAGSTQYYSKVFATEGECSANAKLSGAELRLPTGAARDTAKPIVCSCSGTLASQGASCDVAKFNSAQAIWREAQGGTTAPTTPTAPTSPQTGATTPTSPQVKAPDSLGFVPLTSIPGIESAGNSATLPDFLNNLYKLAIGVAAVLAVLQIVRAGIMYMGGDSVTEKKEARNLITLSIGGLILILSPVIVFSVINPKILDLKIDGLDALGDTRFGKDAQRAADIVGRSETLLWQRSDLSRSAAETKCKTDGGKLSFQCRTTDGTVRNLSLSQTCKAGEETLASCIKTGTSAPLTDTQTQALCETYHRQIAPSGASCSIVAGESWGTVNPACCFDVKEGQQCCGKLKVSTEPDPGAPNINQNLVVRFYVYRPSSGDPSPLGPVPADKNSYEAYASACSAKSGEKANKYGNSIECSTAEYAALTDSRKAYIKCMPATISCVLP